MSFSVQPNRAYNISIGVPGVTGEPEPTISYEWTYNGTNIGTNSRFISSFVFDTLPGTLACTITLSNLAGSVSQTVTASIIEADPALVFKPISIRTIDNPTKCLIQLSISDIGKTLKVGGPSNLQESLDIINESSVSYQWKRDGVDISGATSNTYTLTSNDEDTVISVTAIATGNDLSTLSRSAKIKVGDPELTYEDSHIGSHLGQWTSISRYASSVPFVNLVYSACNDVRGDDSWNRPSSSEGNQLMGWGVKDWGQNPPIFTEDGWPYQTITGENLSPTGTGSTGLKYSRLYINSGEAKWWTRFFNILQLEASYDSYAPKGPEVQDRLPDKIFGQPIQNRKFTYELHTYWQGNGYAEAKTGAGAPSTEKTPTQVLFTGPENKGPWGINNEDTSLNGPQTMYKVTNTYTYDISEGINPGLFAFITRSTKPDVDPTPWSWNTGPTRNVMAMIGKVTDVTDPLNPVVVYDGFDHTTYNPFQAYPLWIKKFKHNKCIRSLTLGQARNYIKRSTEWENAVYAAPGPHQRIIENNSTLTLYHQPRGSNPNRLEELNITPDGSYTIYTQPYFEEQPMVKMGWVHSNVDGANRGDGAMSRPTYVCFGRSIRGLVELCNQIDADVWWNHQPYVTFVGTKDAITGEITYATNRGRSGAGARGELTYPYDQTQVGDLLFDEEYVDGFIGVIDRYLKPTLSLYNEWGNEVWNYGASYREMYDYAATMFNRLIASEEEGGDGHLVARAQDFALQSNALFSGSTIPNINNTDVPRTVWNGASSAIITRRMRQKLSEWNSNRSVYSMMAGRINQNKFLYVSLAHLFNTMPILFKELDAITVANYHGMAAAKSKERFDTQPLTATEHGITAVDQLGNIPFNLRTYISPLELKDYPLQPAPEVPPDNTSTWFSGNNETQESAQGNGISAFKAITTKYTASDIACDFKKWNYEFADGIQEVTDWRPYAVIPGSRASIAGAVVSQRVNIPYGWPVQLRRWNLKLLAYEGGPYPDGMTGDNAMIQHGIHISPYYYKFIRRNFEAYFFPSLKTTSRNPVVGQEIGSTGVTEDQIYRSGMVPDTVTPNQGSTFDLIIDMTTGGIDKGLYAYDFWFEGHENAPRWQAREETAFFGLGGEDWAENYCYDALTYD